jgi:hypothetical protein
MGKAYPAILSGNSCSYHDPLNAGVVTIPRPACPSIGTFAVDCRTIWVVGCGRAKLLPYCIERILDGLGGGVIESIATGLRVDGRRNHSCWKQETKEQHYCLFFFLDNFGGLEKQIKGVIRSLSVTESRL